MNPQEAAELKARVRWLEETVGELATAAANSAERSGRMVDMIGANTALCAGNSQSIKTLTSIIEKAL